MATIRDIAKAAGVTPSTVSKALNGSSDTSQATQKHIRSIAFQMGYNMDSLRSKKSNNKTIGVVFPEFDSSYYVKIFESFRRHMENEGYSVIARLTDFGSFEKQAQSLDFFIDSHVSGILYLTEDLFKPEHIKELAEKASVKMVMVTMMNGIDFCDVINVNHSLGIRIGVEYLQKLGHRKITFIGENNTIIRQNSFVQSMQDLGLDIKPENVIVNNQRFQECGYMAMQTILNMPPEKRPTACFAAYDEVAYGAMKALYNAGLSIPEDMSIIGVNNNKTSEYLTVPLSSIDLPIEEIGIAASKNLLRRINKDTAPYKMTLYSPKLVARESTTRPFADKRSF